MAFEVKFLCYYKINMSKKAELVKRVKLPKEDVEEKKEPKKRVSRAKPKPTKEQVLKMLSDSSTEVKQIIQEIKEEEKKLIGQPLKRVFELITETVKNLEEDLQEIDEEYKELLALPAEENK